MPRTAAPPTAIVPAAVGTMVYTTYEDGTAKVQPVVAWHVTAGSPVSFANAIVFGDALDLSAKLALIEPEMPIDHSTGRQITDNPEDRREMLASDVQAIAKAVEQHDDPSAYLSTGPGLPGERQSLPGQDNPTPHAADIGDLANDPARVAEIEALI